MLAVPHSAAALDFRPTARLHPSPEDWRDQFFYFLLVDRFDNGASGVAPYRPGQPTTGHVPAQRGRFQGGTLKGVTRRLDYIRDLGCTDQRLSGAGQTMRNLLAPELPVKVGETSGRAFVRLKLSPHGLAIMKCG